MFNNIVDDAKESIEKVLNSPIDGIGLSVKQCVDKQRARGLLITGTEEGKYYRCPCGQILLTEYNNGSRTGRITKHCEACGQRLEYVVKIEITEGLGSTPTRAEFDKGKMKIYFNPKRTEWMSAELAKELGMKWREVYETA
jgi:hypothetical protein